MNESNVIIVIIILDTTILNKYLGHFVTEYVMSLLRDEDIPNCLELIKIYLASLFYNWQWSNILVSMSWNCSVAMLKYSEFGFRVFEGMWVVKLSFWCPLLLVPITFFLTK